MNGWRRAGFVVASAVLALCAWAAPTLAKSVGLTDGVTANLRPLDPYGDLVQLGNFPGGAAVTPDGRFYWNIDAGWSQDDVKIVDVQTRKVIQTIKLPGTSGGVALDGVHHLAYVSGEPDTDIGDVKMPDGTPGKSGDVIQVFSWDNATGLATQLDPIPVPPPALTLPVDSFPPEIPPKQRSWPERLAVSPDGKTLLVALGLADQAAVIDTDTKQVRYVNTGSHPFGAAIMPEGKTGLISNRGPGSVSVIDLATAQKTKDILVGPHLSHPEQITMDPVRPRAYVPLANGDAVAVINTDTMELEHFLPVGVPQGAGSAPVSTAVTPDGSELLVAHSAADEISVYGLEKGDLYDLLGRIPTADYPTDVNAVNAPCPSSGGGDGIYQPGQGFVSAANKHKKKKKRKKHHRRKHRHHRKKAQTPKVAHTTSNRAAGCPTTLLWSAGKGFGLGPNTGPPFESQYFDIPTAFSTKGLVTGYAGIAPLPTRAELPALSDRTAAQLNPINDKSAPAGTPLRPNGPIEHVFYIVRENRSYDQVLGDLPRGDGDPRYAIFGNQVTPNAHALAMRFPTLDHFYADSEASIDGHYWTAAATTSDYVHRTWRQNYAGRGYPTDAWFYQIAFPQTGFLFDQAEKQGVSWINLGEGVVHLAPLPDRDKDLTDYAGNVTRYSHSDLGLLTPGGCYDPFIGQDDIANVAHIPINLFDSSLPAGAPQPALSRYDCFATHFNVWQLTNSLPKFVYMTFPNDHTNGGSAGRRTPRAMVADNDRALGQTIDAITHSPYWPHSAIFVVEDDSQDGFDHVDAHRIPAFVISPYAKTGVVSTPYDMVSAIRSMELILGLKPLNLFDAQATPMYDAFTSTPDNSAPFSALPSSYPLLETNGAPTSAAAVKGAQINTTIPDQISQRLLDKILWKSVHGADSKVPPPGPNAEEGG